MNGAPPHFGHGLSGRSAFDRDLSGYLIGDVVTIPAGSGFNGKPRAGLKLLGAPDAILRWKAMLACSIPPGTAVPANAALGLRFHVSALMGNEQILRRCFVRAGQGTTASPDIVGNAQTLYVPGRTLRVEVENPNDVDLDAHYGVDGGTAGYSSWTDIQEITTNAASEVELDMPAFTNVFSVYSISSTAAPEIRGYNANGSLVYREALTAGNSGAQEVVPNLRYTLAPVAGGPFTYTVLYRCLG